MVRSEERRAFALSIEWIAQAPEALARRLDQGLERYSDAHGLQLEGQPALLLVSSDRSLTETDQVDLVDWLIDQSGVAGVRLWPLKTVPTHRTLGGAYLHVAVCDFALIGLTLLYRCRRVSATLYLQILGGFVHRPRFH